MGSAVVTSSRLPSVALRFTAYLHRRGPLQALLVVAISALSFGILMKLSLVVLFGNGIAVCWPMVGLAAAALIKLPRRKWPWVLIGIALGHIYLERIYATSEMVVDTVCDVLEIVVAAFALPAFRSLSDWMKQPRLLWRFLLWPVILGPAITSVAVGAVFAHGFHQGFWSYATRWCFADALGMVLWLPLALVLLSRETYALFRIRTLPLTLALIGLTIAVGTAIFELKPVPVAFLLMPLLLLIALRLHFSGSVLAVNMLTIITSLETLHGRGPFGLMEGQYRVMALQMFLASCMLMCFPVSIILFERDEFERELKEAFIQMQQLAINDGLTSLANRRRFDSELHEEWRRAKRDRHTVGLLLIDVDCFKLFNDCYGHVAGDQCLRMIAEAIAPAAQRVGDLAGRYGGEEFVVLLPQCDLVGLCTAAEGIRLRVEALNLKHERSSYQRVTVSIGCWSTVPGQEMSRELLIESADQALYSAKQQGRNRVETFGSTSFKQAKREAKKVAAHL